MCLANERRKTIDNEMAAIQLAEEDDVLMAWLTEDNGMKTMYVMVMKEGNDHNIEDNVWKKEWKAKNGHMALEAEKKKMNSQTDSMKYREI